MFFSISFLRASLFLREKALITRFMFVAKMYTSFKSREIVQEIRTEELVSQ